MAGRVLVGQRVSQNARTRGFDRGGPSQTSGDVEMCQAETGRQKSGMEWRIMVELMS
jgi:hypothetical protein